MKCTPCKMKTFFPVKQIWFIRSLAKKKKKKDHLQMQPSI